VTGELLADDALPIERLLFRQHRVLTRQQAVTVLGRYAVDANLGTGLWQSPCRGVIVAHNGSFTRRQQLWIAILHGGPGAVCGGATAATLLGLRGHDSPDIHVVIPADRQASPMDGVQVHRATVLPAAHVLDQSSPPQTTMARSIVDAAAWAATDEEAREFVAAAVRQGKVLPGELADVLKVLPRSKRRALVMETVNLTLNGAEALADHLLVKVCRRQGLPVPDRQVRRPEGEGKPRYLDAYWHRWQLSMVVDAAPEGDAGPQEDAAQPAADFIPGWALLHRQDEVATRIRTALVQHGWRP
jgi:hypothetical protein